jgi:hypothetical protein
VAETVFGPRPICAQHLPRARELGLTVRLPRPAVVHLGGRSVPSYWTERVEVVDETHRRRVIRLAGEEPIRLSGRGRWSRPGEATLAPKASVTSLEASGEDARSLADPGLGDAPGPRP